MLKISLISLIIKSTVGLLVCIKFVDLMLPHLVLTYSASAKNYVYNTGSDTVLTILILCSLLAESDCFLENTNSFNKEFTSGMYSSGHQVNQPFIQFPNNQMQTPCYRNVPGSHNTTPVE